MDSLRAQELGEHGRITVLLRRWGKGDEKALDQLVPLVEAELRRIARRLLRNERYSPTLDRTTALVNETYARLLDQAPVAWEHRAHFLGISARLMRQILVDHARRRQARKRRAPSDAPPRPAVAPGLDDAELLDLNRALRRLSRLDERQGRIVELRVFGGLKQNEIATLLGVSRGTVARDWRNARLWLRRELRTIRP